MIYIRCSASNSPCNMRGTPACRKPRIGWERLVTDFHAHWPTTGSAICRAPQRVPGRSRSSGRLCIGDTSPSKRAAACRTFSAYADETLPLLGRAGFGIYIDDASFSRYRRVVQRLAQQGKLAVVFSDESLVGTAHTPRSHICASPTALWLHKKYSNKYLYRLSLSHLDGHKRRVRR